MPKSTTVTDFKQIFIRDLPLIDLRAPIEFARGSFPSAVSIPLMNDDERQQVGLCYKEKGQQAAIDLGHQLVSGSVKQQRLDLWRAFAGTHPEGMVFCFRGGMRSQITQAWLAESGMPYPLVSGGYKALRRYLIDQMDRIISQHASYVLAGRTGSDKTRLINSLARGVDLEGMANHRGSSFGRPIDDIQPTQINFENSLAVRLLKLEAQSPEAPMIFEDESPRIGGLDLPDSLNKQIASQPVLIVDEPLEKRIETIHKAYISSRLDEFLAADPVAGFQHFSRYLLQALYRVRKRLGGVRFQSLQAMMQQALKQQEWAGGDDAHRDWIKQLLTDYYDPMYDYQLSKKDNPILFRGAGADVLDYCKNTLSLHD